MAVSLPAGDLSRILSVDHAMAERLLAVGSALVTRYAPDAPDAISNEALIRVAGWLAEAPASGARVETTGDITTTWTPSQTGALRASGAMGLLSPFKLRRAGAI